MKIKPSTIILGIQSRQAAGDKIGAIKYARKRLGCGLAKAKEFCDYVAWRTGQADTVADIHSDWCYECYDTKPCKRPHPEPQPQPSVSDLIRANRDRCPCGRKPCTDGFHANLAALIRKHGTSRAVELIHIWMGLKEPEDEAQARFVESQPGYRPIYREQQQ